MTDEKRNSNQRLVDKVIDVLLGLPWPEVLRDGWKIARKAMQGRADRGLYEALKYKSTLELEDGRGERAAFKKREKARYLQDNVIAYQDQAWGMERSSSTIAAPPARRWTDTDPATRPTSSSRGVK
jgi:hypothetical protein